MTFRDVTGWWSEDDQRFYRKMVEESPSPANFVELGCWFGSSTTYMAAQICASGKDIRLFSYDTFEGSVNEPDMVKSAALENVEGQFVRNMRQCGFHIERLSGDAPNGWEDKTFMPRFLYAKSMSADAASYHPDASVDFVFVDACHSFEAVIADIRSASNATSGAFFMV